ncbi:type II toxin-antitoxin system VapB family antitoxin [Glycocaulis sp.]|uniref:type II toxin-antitoxin system VapB family antitoxin n=1 Tax=Glycocaulis sp. TaxID=1969725 RepID=UPI003F728035
MTLSIKDPQTDALARKLAELKGQTITDAVRAALEAEIARAERGETARQDRIRALVERVAAGMEGSGHSLDHGDLLYDEIGLPK